MRTKQEFKKIYIEYSDKIYRFFYWHTGDIHLAEDLTSEVFVRAWRSRKKFINRYPQAWLFRIARNLLIDHYRRKKDKYVEDADVELPPHTENHLEMTVQKEEIRRLRKALANLPDNLRSVVILRFIERLPAKEVGKILKVSEGNVRVMQYRALTKLKEFYNDGKTV